jgi:hypothetical protein
MPSNAGVIATPMRRIFSLARQVFCQKPSTPALEDAAELVEAAERADSINDRRRNCPIFRGISASSSWLPRSAGGGILDQGREVCLGNECGFYFSQDRATICLVPVTCWT